MVSGSVIPIVVGVLAWPGDEERAMALSIIGSSPVDKDDEVMAEATMFSSNDDDDESLREVVVSRSSLDDDTFGKAKLEGIKRLEKLSMGREQVCPRDAMLHVIYNGCG